MAEWTKATVLKTVMGATSSWVRIPLPPPLSGMKKARRPKFTSLLFWAVPSNTDQLQTNSLSSHRLGDTSINAMGFPSSGWIWKRFFNGGKFRMWEIHKLEMEIFDMYEMMKSLGSTHSSSPANAIMMQEIDALEYKLERLQSKANF